jgi:ribulose-5-phosphate 4-epimerase/fuculose-1-phosphate aldolase
MADAFDDLYYLERACMLQVMAMSTGKALRIVPEAIAAKTGRQMAEASAQSALHFAALQRMLDRDEPGWRG